MNDLSAKRLTLLRRNRPRKALLVRTAAGPTIGFGHLRRTLTLARRLRHAARLLFLLDPGDCWSREQVARQGFDYQPFDPKKPWPMIESPAALLIDTRRKAGLRRLIAGARRRRIPVASIHDLGLAPLPSDVVFDGSIVSAAGGCARGNAAFFAGTGYLVLEDSCARFHRKTRLIRPRIRRVVINLGGGNGGCFFRKVLRGMRSANSPLEVVGLPGFCSWGQESLSGPDGTLSVFAGFPEKKMR